MLDSLPSGVRPEVDDIRLFEILRGSGFDPFPSLVTYSRSSDVNWACVEPAQCGYPNRFPSGRVFDVPERRLMSAGCDDAGNLIHGSEYEPMRAVRWQGHGSGFESASTLVSDTYGDTIDDVVSVVAVSLESALLEEDDDWNLGEISLSRNDDVHASLRGDFTAI